MTTGESHTEFEKRGWSVEQHSLYTILSKLVEVYRLIVRLGTNHTHCPDELAAQCPMCAFMSLYGAYSAPLDGTRPAASLRQCGVKPTFDS
jgi:hypothetical protein